jgi:glycerol uptake facilitator
MTPKPTLLPGWLLGEFCGTFLLIFFGCGAGAGSLLLGAPLGAFQIAAVWGLAVATAIYLTGGLSGPHLNPAVTLALAVWSGFPWRRVGGYVVGQMLGAFVASAVLYGLFAGPLAAFEAAQGIARGAPGSEASAMIFGEYFPNPGGHPLTAATRELVSPATAFLAEALATGILMLVVLGLNHPGNAARPKDLTALAIGLTVTLLIAMVGPLTMACFNPARDLAPRIFSALAGWGRVPFTTNGHGWWTVYIVAPLSGALAGGGIFQACFRPRYENSGPT